MRLEETFFAVVCVVVLAKGIVLSWVQFTLSSRNRLIESNNFKLITTPRPSRSVLLAKQDNGETSNKHSSPIGRGRRPMIIRRNSVVAKEIQERKEIAQERYNEALKDPTLLSNIEFSDPVLALHPSILQALTEVIGVQTMTQIQAQTWAPLMAGKSILARARTGTGKTLAFLLPAIQKLLEADLTTFRSGRNIGLLVIVPTRELAVQIGDEADKLLTFLKQQPNLSYTVQVVTGGTKIQRDKAVLNQKIPTVLVATPGRLLDLLKQKIRCSGNLPFTDVLAQTKLFVLDEADRLMEAFPNEVHKIFTYLPGPQRRQTMLFSATVPVKMKDLLSSEDNKILSPEFQSVDCIEKGTKQNNVRVKQSYVQLRDMRSYLATVLSIIDDAMQHDPENYKLVVFFPTAKLVKFMYDVLSTVKSPQTVVLSIHSRMSAGARSRAHKTFQEAKQAILLTSDVSARGIDYPDITLVIQVGAPFKKDLYWHRLGRTGRAGKAGAGLLILLPFETNFIRRLRDVDEDSRTLVDEEGLNPNVVVKLNQITDLVGRGQNPLYSSAVTACTSFAAHYLDYSVKKMTSGEILSAIESLACSFGLESAPQLQGELAVRLGCSDAE